MKNACIDEPVPGFEISDLFLSRTDRRGVIQSGNDTFQRLAGYSWQELIGAPHKIIRHPDMPKAAFYLLWNALQAGKPFGAYVKNRAKDGRHYWVFAVIAPVDDGYLSVRLKPTTAYFDEIRSLYSRLLEAEKKGATLEEGTRIIDETVREHGFRDYVAFMGFALGAELVARSAALDRPVDPSVGEFEKMGQLLVALSEEVRKVEDLFEGISSSPKNLNILGSRLSSGREAMQVVAQNYELLSNEILSSILELSDRLHLLLEKAFTGRMAYCASQLYHEAINSYATNENSKGTEGHVRELAILEGALSRFQLSADEGCEQIQHEVDAFETLTVRLRQMLSGLAVTRVVCRIEAASLHEDTKSIDEISDRLTVFQDELGQSLDRIGDACGGLSQRIPQPSKASRRVA